MAALFEMFDGAKYGVGYPVDLRQEGFADHGDSHAPTVPGSIFFSGARRAVQASVRQDESRQVSTGCQTFMSASATAELVGPDRLAR